MRCTNERQTKMPTHARTANVGEDKDKNGREMMKGNYQTRNRGKELTETGKKHDNTRNTR